MSWLLLALSGQAQASACCVGSTSSLPSRLGRCEQAAYGLSIGGSSSRLRYDGSGHVADSSLQQADLVATGFVGLRWSRWGQVGLSVPGSLGFRSTDSLAQRGGGVGDLRLGAVLETPNERLGPSPVMTLGLRLPTGTSWEQSSSALGADITGRGGLGFNGTVGLERTSSAWPWTLSAGAQLDQGKVWQLSPSLSGTVGRSLGLSWTVSGGLEHQRSFGLPRSSASSRTRASVQLVHGQPLRYRAWVSVGSDLPVTWLGQDRALEHAASVGLVRLF